MRVDRVDRLDILWDILWDILDIHLNLVISTKDILDRVFELQRFLYIKKYILYSYINFKI